MTKSHDYLILSMAATSALLVCVPAPISWGIAVPTLPLMTYLEIHELQRTRPLQTATVWYCLSAATILMGLWMGHRVAYGLLYFAAFVLINGVMRTWLKRDFKRQLQHDFEQQLQTVQADIAEIRLSTPREVESTIKAEL